MPETSQEEIKVFYCYAREDKDLREELEMHLGSLKRQYHLTTWSDHEILPGERFEQAIDEHLSTADIILLLISPHFMSSDYCYSKEMAQALTRYQEGTCQVIPILLHPTYWEGAPFSHIQLLPTNAQAITSWPNRYEAFLDVVKGISAAVKALQNRAPSHEQSTEYTANDTSEHDHQSQPVPQHMASAGTRADLTAHPDAQTTETNDVDQSSYGYYRRQVETRIALGESTILIYAKEKLAGKEVKLDNIYTKGSNADYQAFIGGRISHGQTIYVAEFSVPQAEQYTAWIEGMPRYTASFPFRPGQIVEVSWLDMTTSTHTAYEHFRRQMEAAVLPGESTILIYAKKELAGKEVKLDNIYTKGSSADHRAFISGRISHGQTIYVAEFSVPPAEQYTAWIEGMPEYTASFPFQPDQVVEMSWW